MNTFRFIQSQLVRAVILLNHNETSHSAVSWAADNAAQLYPKTPKGQRLLQIVDQLGRDIDDAYLELQDPEMFKSTKLQDRNRALELVKAADDKLSEWEEVELDELRKLHGK